MCFNLSTRSRCVDKYSSWFTLLTESFYCIGIVGSIRRSVEKMKSRATRRSTSVPGNLNTLDDHSASVHKLNIDMEGGACATPQIMKKNVGDDHAGFSVQRRWVDGNCQFFIFHCMVTATLLYKLKCFKHIECRIAKFLVFSTL